MDDDENSIYTINILNEFIEKAHETLKYHPINMMREKRGLPPANYLLMRGAGIETPKLKIYKNWVSASYMPLETGFSKICGMKSFSFEYPKLKKLDVYQNLHDGLKKACKFSIKVLKKNRKSEDYAYVHFKEMDVAGHDNKPLEKKAMLEYVDKTFFKFLRKFAMPNKIKVLVTADHATPCALNSHSADFVPVMIYNDSPPSQKKFCEKEARKGSLGRILGNELFKKTGFVK